MSNPYEVKIGIIENITSTHLFDSISVSDESKIRIVISNSNGSNVTVVRGRINGQEDYDTLSTITGDSKSVINISTYDELQVECTTYGSTSNHVRVVVSSFNPAGGSTVIDAPTGGSVDSDTIEFTSSDNSVTITADPLNNTIDFVSAGAGSPFIKYIKTVVLGDWVGPSAGEYTLTIPFSFHGVTNPVAACYETNGLTFDLVMVAVNVNASHDIVITTNQTPDTRFVGKIVIE
jgi:hypothetical protein